MRKILLNVAVTLDGFIEGPAGEYDWCFTDQDYGMKEFIECTDTILFGRKSYDVLLKMDKDAWATHSKIVFSRTLKNMEGAKVINDNVKESVMQIKQQPGKDIWLFGGAELTDALLADDLIDEMHLSIHPILLGQGKTLFNNKTRRTQLILKDSKTYSTGLVQVIYGFINEGFS